GADTLHQPDVARPDRALDAGGGGRALRGAHPRLRATDEGPRIPGHQPHGQSAGPGPRRHGRDRERGHPELPGRDVPTGRAHARGPRRLLPVDVLRGGVPRILHRQPVDGVGGRAREARARGLRLLRGRGRGPSGAPVGQDLLLRRTLHRGGRLCGIPDQLGATVRHPARGARAVGLPRPPARPPCGHPGERDRRPPPRGTAGRQWL
ncbi:MAG: Glutathione S-transferase, partial [uncultured Rubellimicrobium sp.]